MKVLGQRLPLSSTGLIFRLNWAVRDVIFYDGSMLDLNFGQFAGSIDIRLHIQSNARPRNVAICNFHVLIFENSWIRVLGVLES
jgi:hypothetical protein